MKKVTCNQGDETTASASVAYKLSKCKQDAHRKMMVEKRNRTFHEVNTFNKLIGKSIEGKLNTEILSQMNTATIQVIVNDFHNKIENLNEELVNELMKKDELQVIYHTYFKVMIAYFIIFIVCTMYIGTSLL